MNDTKQVFSVKKTTGIRQKLQHMAATFSKQKYLQIMVLLGVVWMIIFCYIPIYGIVIAFKDYKITASIGAAPWVGLEHFREFFADENFKNIMTNTLAISGLKLLINFPLPIAFAILLNELPFPRFKKATQTISYLPHFISWVILGGILINWLSDVGLINELLLRFGVITEPIYFLGESKYFWWISVFSDLWKELGWSAIIYLAAIAGIDPSLYEAATVDGATRLQKIRHITLPAIKSTISLLFVLQVGSLLNSNFDQIFVLRNPLNIERSNVIDMYVYTMGISSNRPSYATAIGLFKSIISLVLLLLARLVTNRMSND